MSCPVGLPPTITTICHVHQYYHLPPYILCLGTVTERVGISFQYLILVKLLLHYDYYLYYNQISLASTIKSYYQIYLTTCTICTISSTYMAPGYTFIVLALPRILLSYRVLLCSSFLSFLNLCKPAQTPTVLCCTLLQVFY